MGLDVHPGVYQPQLMSGGQSENGLLPPPPTHPQHMAPPHIEVAHAAGMMHLGGMPVSQSPAYIDSSAAMMISPGPPPPVATMVSMPSHLTNQQSHDVESYVQHHHQQQQHEIHLQQQQQQHHHDDEHQQQQLVMRATARVGSNIAAALSDEGTMTPPIHAPQHHVVIPQHVLASGEGSITPEAGTPEPSTLDVQQQYISVTPTPVQDGSNDGTSTLGGSHAPSPYPTSVDGAAVYPSGVSADQIETENVHQGVASEVSQQENETGNILHSEEYPNLLQQQQQPETASMTRCNITANHDTASLVDEQVAIATEPGDKQSDIARLNVNPTDK